MTWYENELLDKHSVVLNRYMWLGLSVRVLIDTEVTDRHSPMI